MDKKDDEPKPCWKVSPENQKAFAEFWGDDFFRMGFQNYWIGASSDGLMIGVYLKAQDKEVRASMPFEMAVQMQANLSCALGTAIDRMQEKTSGPKAN